MSADFTMVTHSARQQIALDSWGGTCNRANAPFLYSRRLAYLIGDMGWDLSKAVLQSVELCDRDHHS
jgi:hypothetical protein